MEYVFRYAHQVSVGDEVLVEINDKLDLANVRDIENSVMQGAHCWKHLIISSTRYSWHDTWFTLKFLTSKSNIIIISLESSEHMKALLHT